MDGTIRIGLDARMDKPWMTGLGRYARSLVQALTAMDRTSEEIRWVVIKHPSMASVRFATRGANAEEVTVPGDLDTLENLRAAPRLNALKLDLYHALENFVPPGLRAGKVVVTTHDLVWVEQPGLTMRGRLDLLRTPVIRAYGTVAMGYAFRRADAVVSVSEATRQAALRCFPVLSPSRISTVHHGVDRESFPPRTGPEPAAPYLMMLGNTRPYKNVPAALKGFARLEDPDVRLVIAGRGDWFSLLSSLARKLGVSERVTFKRKAEDHEILALLQGARALVFPSLVEGFGLPVIEAMSAGCPVLGSAVPVVQEICGDGARFFDPRDPGQIAAAMGEVLASAEVREDLRQRGYERIKAFTWSRCAEQTMAVYRSVLDDAASR